MERKAAVHPGIEWVDAAMRAHQPALCLMETTAAGSIGLLQ